MPNFERNLRQKLTYWEVVSYDQYNKPTFADPIQLNCRWEDVAEAVIDKYGAEIISKSRIFLAVPIRVQGYVLPGEYTFWVLESGEWDDNGVWVPNADWNGAPIDPLTLEGIQEVRQVKSVPDLRANKQMYTVWL
jgi:hypothetical protein